MMIRLSIIFSFCITVTTAQTSIKNISLTRPDTNLLYIGMRNVLSISGVDLKRCEVTATNSKIDTTGGIISIIPQYEEKYDTLTVISKNKVLIKKNYIILKLPNIDFKISNSRDSVIIKEVLISFPYMSAFLPYCLFKHSYRITSFDLKIQRTNQREIFYKAISNKYTREMIDEIKSLKSGDKLFFNNIICGCPDCAQRNLGSRTIRLK